MHWIGLAFPALVVVVVAAIAFRPQRDTGRERQLVTASRESGLALTPEIERVVLRRERRAWRYALLGSMGGLLVAYCSSPGTYYAAGLIWLYMGAMSFGGGLGNALAAMVDARGARLPDAPRMARSRAVSVADYVPDWERRSGWIATAVMTAGAACCGLAGIREPLLVLGLPLLVGLSALAATVLSTLIVARPQHAASTLDLAWDDALRAKNLKAIFAVAPIVASYGVLAMTSPIWLQWGEFGIAPLVVLVFVFAAALVHARSTGRASRSSLRGRYSLRRLWPETAAELAMAEQVAQ